MAYLLLLRAYPLSSILQMLDFFPVLRADIHLLWAHQNNSD